MVRLARALSRIAVLAFAVVLCSGGGCARDMTAKIQYAEETDFAQYETFRWITDDLVLIQAGTGNERIRNVENEKRIRAAVEREMQARGMRQVDEDADLVVAFTVGTKMRYRLEGGDRFSTYSSGPGAKVTRGTLTLYVFDPRRGEQVWEAWTSRDLDPNNDPDEVIDEAVALLMAEFPPADV